MSSGLAIDESGIGGGSLLVVLLGANSRSMVNEETFGWTDDLLHVKSPDDIVKFYRHLLFNIVKF